MGGRQLHFGYNVLFDGMHPAAWRLPGSDPVGALTPEQWSHITKVAERGTLDAVFLADSPSLMGDPAKGPGLAYDPTVLLSFLAGQTERIGFIATISSTYEEPYNLARRVLSLDRLSHGRAAWNVVTGVDAGAAANFSARPHLSRAERYQRAEEFTDVVTALWDSWEPDAIVADQVTGLFADPEKVHKINHHGIHFDVEGPLNVPHSPQGRPVLFQAGGSPPGLELAARHADGVFASLGTIKQARAYSDDLRRRAVKHGRRADSIRVMPGLSYVLGSTEAEARARYELLNEIAGEDRREWIAWQLGVDPDELAWEEPLPASLLEGTELSANGSQGAREIVVNIARDNRELTLRQLAERVLTWHRLFVGTPEQLADDLQEWFEAGVVDGFNLMPDVNPSGIELFVDHVVPILRERGLFRHEYAGTTLRDHLELAEVGSPERIAV
ncbi:MAG: LLM class flavin-dependent oxidoreductase [Solirubrobacterales bacterium]|nr:LLM class flavin-dependent oxidoreductase [Solirubrobacterales bacterium]